MMFCIIMWPNMLLFSIVKCPIYRLQSLKSYPYHLYIKCKRHSEVKKKKKNQLMFLK